MIFHMVTDELLNKIKVALVNRVLVYDWEVDKPNPVNRLTSTYCDYQKITEDNIRITPIASNLIPDLMNTLPAPLFRKKDVQWFLLENLQTRDIHFGVC